MKEAHNDPGDFDCFSTPSHSEPNPAASAQPASALAATTGVATGKKIGWVGTLCRRQGHEKMVGDSR